MFKKRVSGVLSKVFRSVKVIIFFAIKSPKTKSYLVMHVYTHTHKPNQQYHFSII